MIAGNRIDPKELAQGRWKGLLPLLGVNPAFLSGKQVGCPTCGGVDRFRFTDLNGHGMSYCNSCGSRDGYQLACDALGVPFKEVVRRVKDMVVTIKADAPKRAMDDAARKRMLNGAWEGGVRIEDPHPVFAYLKRRLGIIEFPRTLRAHDGLTDGEGGTWPALIARVFDPIGKPVTLHRTFVAKDGGKADIDSPRKLMPGPFPKGSAIRLCEAREHMGIGEGIETSLSASILFKVPTWAAIDAGRLMEWIPPAGTTRVTIFGDADASHTGQMAAHTAAHRLIKLGLQVEVKLPEVLGRDWNDILMETL